MSAEIYDIKSGRLLNPEEPIEQQQDELTDTAVMEAFQEIASMLKAQGYRFQDSVLVMPHSTEDVPPCTIAMSQHGSVKHMQRVLKRAYVQVAREAAREDKFDGDTPDAG